MLRLVSPRRSRSPRLTGSSAYLKIAQKWVACAAAYFGVGKHRGTCGHPEVEMALVELFRETGNKSCLDLAEFFLNERGKDPRLFKGNIYLQDHAPLREQTTMEGHAVRQFYLCCGIADLYAEKGEKILLQNLKKQHFPQKLVKLLVQ